MWGRTTSHHAEYAQDAADFGATSTEIDRILQDESGHVTFWSQNASAGPNHMDPIFYQMMQQVVGCLYEQDSDEQKDGEEDQSS
jgi:hypothetical protein